MIMNTHECFVCGVSLEKSHRYAELPIGPRLTVHCHFCGEYQIDKLATHRIPFNESYPSIKKQAAARNALRPLVITVENFQQILDTPRPRIDDRALKLLRLTYDECQIQPFDLDLTDQNTMIQTWSYNKAELNYLLEDVLFKDMGYIGLAGLLGARAFSILPKAIRWLESGNNENSKQVFVAMWFDELMDLPFAQGIAKGIEQADGGCTAFKINDKNHNNKIDDEIVAEIKRSKFLIADFTGHRGGVYYEAGLAQGLGLPVIWTCRKDDIEKLHFDIRQYNCIAWEIDKLDALAKAVKDRINATIN
jgi:hypothetical protein